MDRFAHGIINHRKTIIVLFIIAAVVCAPLTTLVKVNYNVFKYLPSEAQSTEGLTVMNEQFGEAIPNTRVMTPKVSVVQALEYKERIKATEGIEEVLWLDDMIDIHQPLEMVDASTVEEFYKDGYALFTVTMAKGSEQVVTKALQDLVGSEGAVAGDGPSMATVQSAAMSEVLGALAILVPAILILFTLSTSAWVEPVLFIIAIGISIIMNMGSNVMFKDVSFITNTVSPILQLGCSLDYAVFLLHSFGRHRNEHENPEMAMFHAIKESFSAIAASASTTLFGFIALVFMSFLIGVDLGINLAKGIILSFVSCIIFLPALTLSVYKLIDRTSHRPLLPSFAKFCKVLSRLALPVTLIVVIIIVPCFLGQQKTDFLYGSEGAAASNRTGSDGLKIDGVFGHSATLVVLVPKGDVARETALTRDLEKIGHVTGVMSYAQTVGAEIPSEYLPRSVLEQFYSADYARLIVYVDTHTEGDIAFATAENIESCVAGYYPESAYVVGQSANLYDMKIFITADNLRVNLIAVFSILMVLVVVFRSAVLPFILLFTIESAIWINMAIPYFMDMQLNYIGYLVLNTVQLGATVDYAILFATTYLHKRRQMPVGQALILTSNQCVKSILVSALTLSIAGFALWGMTTNPIIADIGLLLGRGTLLSVGLVLTMLPLLLKVFDKPIGKLTHKANFFKEPAARVGQP